MEKCGSFSHLISSRFFFRNTMVVPHSYLSVFVIPSARMISDKTRSKTFVEYISLLTRNCDP